MRDVRARDARVRRGDVTTAGGDAQTLAQAAAEAAAAEREVVDRQFAAWHPARKKLVARPAD